MAELIYQPAPATPRDRLDGLEARLARIEAKLGLDSTMGAAPAGDESGSARGGDAFPPGAVRIEDELGQQIGLNGFAMTGVITLTIGVG